MTDLRQPFALVAAIRRGLDALQFCQEHNLAPSPEHTESLRLLGAELAEGLAGLVDAD